MQKLISDPGLSEVRMESNTLTKAHADALNMDKKKSESTPHLSTQISPNRNIVSTDINININVKEKFATPNFPAHKSTNVNVDKKPKIEINN